MELQEKTMATTDELFDELIRNCKKPEDLIGKNGLLEQLLSNGNKNTEARNRLHGVPITT
jgi:hypothetical protein